MMSKLTLIGNESVVVLRITTLLDQDINLLTLQLLTWETEKSSILKCEIALEESYFSTYLLGTIHPTEMNACSELKNSSQSNWAISPFLEGLAPI